MHILLLFRLNSKLYIKGPLSSAISRNSQTPSYTGFSIIHIYMFTRTAGGSSGRTRTMKGSATMGDTASWYCGLVLLTLILLGTIRESSMVDGDQESSSLAAVRGNQLGDRPCDEIYVVGDGETLHTISDKCDDPFIVERNPHIHDPDDVFPGLVIKITPINNPQ